MMWSGMMPVNDRGHLRYPPPGRGNTKGANARTRREARAAYMGAAMVFLLSCAVYDMEAGKEELCTRGY